MKATAVAPSNIAFSKYWGKRDESLRIPFNGSISVNLSGLYTTTTVEFDDKYQQDSVSINGKQEEKSVGKVIVHLNRIRKLAKFNLKAKVVSQNNFPTAAGLASSASGFAALTCAAAAAAGLKLSQKELSILARLGSGSACRSIPDGFVEWLDGKTNDTSYAVSIFPADYWDIMIVTVIITDKIKEVDSTEGMKHVFSNPFYPVRVLRMKEKNIRLKRLIREKDFPGFGGLVEAEALELHAIILTSTPAVIYWQPETVAVIKLVQNYRKEGLPVYFTIDAGAHVHLICQSGDLKPLLKKLKESKFQKLIVNRPARGVRLVNEHLF